MEIKLLTIEDYDKTYQLWTNTKGMGMRSFDKRDDLIYRNLSINENNA